MNAERITTVVCLERLGKGEELFVHVSKPPKEGSSSNQFIEALAKMSKLMNSSSSLLHTKINLNEDELHWEHERFSLKKISAMTLSTQYNRSYSKSILDDDISTATLVKNIRVVTETLVRVIYGGVSEETTDLVTDEQWISEESILAELSLITRYPRSQQLLHHKHPLFGSFEKTFKKYLQQTRVNKVKADPRDPEFTLYPMTEVNIVAHKLLLII